MRYVITLLSLVVFPSALAAQKHCTKGIPCGNSCISADKVCRVGNSAAPPATPYVPPQALNNQLEKSQDTQWVAQARGRVYYRAGCSAAQELAELIYFKTQAEAIEKGYKRSQVPGC